MGDELIRQFYARAARTLSIGCEVYRELKRRDMATAETALVRLDLEIAGWRAEIDACNTYLIEYEEFIAASAVWRHVQNIIPKPEMPEWPPILPRCSKFDTTIGGIRRLGDKTADFRSVIKHSIPFDNTLCVMLHSLGDLARALDFLKKQLDENADANDSDPMPPPIVGELQQDSVEKIRQMQPDNVDVRDLCKLLEKNFPAINAGTKSAIGVAREITREPVDKALWHQTWPPP